MCTTIATYITSRSTFATTYETLVTYLWNILKYLKHAFCNIAEAGVGRFRSSRSEPAARAPPAPVPAVAREHHHQHHHQPWALARSGERRSRREGAGGAVTEGASTTTTRTTGTGLGLAGRHVRWVEAGDLHRAQQLGVSGERTSGMGLDSWQQWGEVNMQASERDGCPHPVIVNLVRMHEATYYVFGWLDLPRWDGTIHGLIVFGFLDHWDEEIPR
jgi:hypothetical protein